MRKSWLWKTGGRKRRRSIILLTAKDKTVLYETVAAFKEITIFIVNDM